MCTHTLAGAMRGQGGSCGTAGEHREGRSETGFRVSGSRSNEAAWRADIGLEDVARCHRLERLDLSHCLLVTDEGLLALGASLPNLQLLAVAHCPTITEEGVAAIAQVQHRQRLAWRRGFCSSCGMGGHDLVGELGRGGVVW